MIGTSGKMGRGGATAAKRTLNAPQINRTGRPPMGGGPRGRVAAPSPAISAPAASSMQVEESFSLHRENPLNFGMAIKLAPGLAEEIKRVEAQGGGARIKFDVNPNIPNGNVIRVGDKVFRFTWSREPGDLCDVYEERQSGDDGNKVLVESGGTWRKLNVERELDESTKNHVKRRSEEAERKHKSRKSIVLDPQNPSIKNKVKTVAAESNSWRNSTNRKEPPPKKAKLNPHPGGLPPKPAYITGLSTTTLSKGKISSASPLPSKPDQNGGPVSSFGSGNLVKGHVDITNVAPTQNTKRKRNTEADLKSLVISLLEEHHPTGMSLKALEKATGDLMPNSTRKIEPILKQIAIYQSPGKYLLKSAVVKDGLNKPPSQNGSSQEVNRQQLPLPQPPAQNTSFPKRTPNGEEENHRELNSHTMDITEKSSSPAQDSSFPKRIPPNGEEENQGELNSPLVHTMDITEKIDILQDSPPQQHFSDRKSDSSSSSDSGSDSDSSSDSGSDCSSSDSDSSISSKQASDEEVDIMSNDDKDSNHKLLDSIQSHPNDEHVDIGTCEKQDDVIDIENDSPESGSRKIRDKSESDDSFPKVKSKRNRDDSEDGFMSERRPVRFSPVPKKRKFEKNLGVESSPQVSEAAVSKKASAKSIRPPDYIGAGSQHNKVDVSRRMLINSTDHQLVPVQAVEPQITNGSKKQKPVVVDNSNGRPIDASLTCSNGGGRKEKESSSDENGFLYTKYEKEEPELKGPIKGASEYKEYLKEYQEKYESYCSLSKIMEAYRDEFGKLGKDLEAYKVTDKKRYNDTLKQMRTSFRQSGERHKRQKKIFIIVYKELKHLKQMIKDYAASC